MARLVLADGAVHDRCSPLSRYSSCPTRLDTEAERSGAPRFPIFRLATLGVGVCCVAATGPVDNGVLRVILLVAAVALVGLAFRLDRVAPNKLFPARALSLTAPVGLSLWILYAARA